MRLIHASGFSKMEREGFRGMILTNVVSSMHALLEGMHYMDLTLQNKENWVRKLHK
jgi:guanine nucleotide-binding protein subunit alpha